MTARPGLTGGVAGLVVFVWLLTEGTFDLVASDDSARFFDAQTSAWLDGRWDVDPFVAGVEGIVRDGRTYIYFGIVPSLLRLPIAAIADLDGQWSRLSMLGAIVVAMAATRWIAGEVLRTMRPSGPDRADPWIIAGSVFVVGAGSSLTFLASRPLVYHEAGLWGSALALVALGAVLTVHREPSTVAVVVIGLATTGSLLSRPSAALGPLAATGLLVAGELGRRLGPRLPRRLGFLVHAAPRAPHVGVGSLVAAGAAPVVAYGAVVAARFGTFLRIPFDDQVIALADPERQAFVEAYGYFDPRFVGTNLVNYLAPIGARPTTRYPFVDFAAPPGPQVGDTPLAAFDRVAGLPLAMPALLLFAAIGVVFLVRRRDPELWGPRTAAAGGLVSGLSVLVFGALAHRYTADFVPALAVPATVGAAAAGARGRIGRRTLAVGAGVVVAASVWVNTGLGLTYQRLWGLGVTEDTVAGFLETQADLGSDPGPVERMTALPVEGAAGDLVAIGDCAGLYLHSGRAVSALEPTPWIPVERTPTVGHVELIADLELPAPGAVTLLVSDGVGGGDVRLRVVGHEVVQFLYEGAPFEVAGPEVGYGPGEHRLEVALDPHLRTVTVWLDGALVLSGFYGATDPRIRLVDPVELAAAGFAGMLEPTEQAEPDLCRRLASD